jgi:hypothetical protein
MPLSLTDEEMEVLHRLALPIARGRRQEFLQAVTDALASCPQPGPGVVYRTAREIQRSYAGEADKRRKAQVLVCVLGRQVMVKIAAHAIAAGC